MEVQELKTIVKETSAITIYYTIIYISQATSSINNTLIFYAIYCIKYY